MSSPILVKLAKSREALLAVIAPLAEDVLDRCPADGWTIRQIVTHLVNAEEDHRAIIQTIATGRAVQLPVEFSLDEHNQRRVAERNSLTHPQLLAALADQRQKTEALLASLSEDQLRLSGRHPALGDRTLDEIFRVIALHERMHAQEIAAFLKTP